MRLKKHFEKKQYDGASRNKYFELLAFKARLVDPKISTKINTLLSKVKGYFFQGKAQQDIITVPGFSWDKGIKGKPLKHTALAFQNKRLFICIASLSKSFIINDEKGDVVFVKTTGGQKRKNSEPKSIEYVKGSFQQEAENDMPLMLPLHFGKSYASHMQGDIYLTSNGGSFQKTPRYF
jgi:hypothetical protein